MSMIVHTLPYHVAAIGIGLLASLVPVGHDSPRQVQVKHLDVAQLQQTERERQSSSSSPAVLCVEIPNAQPGVEASFTCTGLDWAGSGFEQPPGTGQNLTSGQNLITSDCVSCENPCGLSAFQLSDDKKSCELVIQFAKPKVDCEPVDVPDDERDAQTQSAWRCSYAYVPSVDKPVTP